MSPVRRHRGLGTILSLASSVVAYAIAKVFGISQDSAFLLMVAGGIVAAAGWFSWIVVDALRGTGKAATAPVVPRYGAETGWWARANPAETAPDPTATPAPGPGAPTTYRPGRPAGW